MTTQQVAQETPVTTPDIIRDDLIYRHDNLRHSWRKIAAKLPYSEIGIPAGTLCTIAKTGKIPNKWKRILGIPVSIKIPPCPTCGEAHSYDCGCKITITKPGQLPKRNRASINLNDPYSTIETIINVGGYEFAEQLSDLLTVRTMK